MAITRYGDANPVWGMSDDTALGFVQESTSRRLADEVTVENYEGQSITVGYTNKRAEGSISVVKGSSAYKALFEALTSANLSDAVGRQTITEVEKRRENKNWERVTYTFKAFDLITA